MENEAESKMSKGKVAALLATVIAVGAGGLYVLRNIFNKAADFNELKKLSDRLQAIPTAKIHKMDLSGLTIRIDVTLKNPTDRGFKMKYPFITVMHQDSTLGSSQAVDTVISIPPNGQAVISNILLNFPLFGLFSILGTLIKSLQSGQGVKLNILTSTTVDPLWKIDAQTGQWKSLRDFGIDKLRAIPYEKSQEVTLKKAIK
jgi:hypothetical protein